MTGNKLDILVICRDKEELEIVFEEILLQEQEEFGLENIELHKDKSIKNYSFIKTPNTKYCFIYQSKINMKFIMISDPDQVIVRFPMSSYISAMVDCILVNSCVPYEFKKIDMEELLEANKERYKKGEKQK